MADAKEKGIALLSSTAAVDLDTTTTETNLYTVPAGKTCIITHVVMRTLSADATASTVSFGVAGVATEFRPTQTVHTNLDNSSTGEYGVVFMQQSTVETLEGGRMVDGGEIFVIKTVAAASIGCTCTVDVFGYLF